MKANKIRNKKGFTLVELMCVIAIIVILSTVLIMCISSILPKASSDIEEVGVVQKSNLNVIEHVFTGDYTGDYTAPTSLSLPSRNSSSYSGSGNGGDTSGSYVPGNTSTGNSSEGAPYIPEETEVVTVDAGQDGEAINHDEFVASINVAFERSMLLGDMTTLSRMIVSNRPVELNAYLQAQGITDAQAFITNDDQKFRVDGVERRNYGSEILTANGISGASYVKIVSVTTDGTVLSDHVNGDSVEVVQYLYYKTKNAQNKEIVVLYATREVTATIRSTAGAGTLNFPADDRDGSSWTVA